MMFPIKMKENYYFLEAIYNVKFMTGYFKEARI